MLKKASKLLSLGLALVMILSLIPTGTVVAAEGESDTTLSELYYTFKGETQVIDLTSDDIYTTLQENRYSITLPYMTKDWTSERLPQVTAVSTYGGNVHVDQIASFPGTAKIMVTSISGETRNYYVRFKYSSGAISELTNNIGGYVTNSYTYHHDLQPMSFLGLRELYKDVGKANWGSYCQAYVDQPINGVSNAANGYKLPDETVQHSGNGEYINQYTGSWYKMWIAADTDQGSTSDLFNGASWIVSANADRTAAYMTAANNNAITFKISRGATIWVAVTGQSTNFIGWDYNSSSGNKICFGGGDRFVAYYTKHFDADKLVSIPSAATTLSKMYIPMIIWDAPGTGNTELSTLTATYGGEDHDIPVVQGQTTYNVEASAIPTFHADLIDEAAELDITQGTSSLGSATITVVSGQTTTVYTINYTSPSNDASLKSLSYTHPELGVQNIALTADGTAYNVELPCGLSSALPQISGVPNDDTATIVEIQQPSVIPGSASMTVQSGAGTRNTYYVYFSKSTVQPEAGTGTVSKLKYRGADAAEPLMAVTGVEATEPVDILNDNISYPTQADKVAAATNPEVNLYKNNALRVYSDREPENSGGSVLGSQMEFAYIVKGEEATSPEFLSPNVTRILTKNDEKKNTDAIPDAYTFTIDKPATVYIAATNNASQNIIGNGWNLDTTGLRVSRSLVATLKYAEGDNADNKNYAIPNGTYSNYTGIYTKHYAASANVSIPSIGSATGSGLIVLIIWDTVPKQVITGLTLHAVGSLEQDAGALETVSFRAVSAPSADVDRSTIEWYVNEVKQSATGANFSYTPSGAGEYVITAKVANNPDAVVEPMTIVVTAAFAFGDVNGDHEIDISDVIMAAEIAVGTPGYTDEQKNRANVSSKTEMAVDISDVVLIAERAVGGTALFPVEK